MKELSGLPPGLINRNLSRPRKYAGLFKVMKKDTWYEFTQKVDFACSHKQFTRNFSNWCRCFGFTPTSRIDIDNPQACYLMFELWGEIGGVSIVSPQTDIPI